MSGFPDNFDAAASGCFPTAADLRAEAADRTADRMRIAVERVDALHDELAFILACMASPPDAEWYDVHDAETLAAELEAIVAKRRPGIGS